MAVRAFKVTINNYPEDQIEYLEAENNRKSDLNEDCFLSLYYIDHDFALKNK